MELFSISMTLAPSKELIMAEPFKISHFDGKSPSASLLGLSWNVCAFIVRQQHKTKQNKTKFALSLV